MTNCGTTTVTDPEEYRARFPGATINLVQTGSGDFKARLTWVSLRRVSLMRIEERLPRIAFLALTPGSIFVTFPIRSRLPMVWGGIEVRPREMVLHSLGDRIHQRSVGPCRWGMIALSPMHLATYSRTLAHEELNPPRVTVFLKPNLPFGRDLRRLHAEACRLAETKPDTMAHREVARALEQQVLYALINCLAARVSRDDEVRRQHYAETMARFEDVLASHCQQHLQIPDVCETVGVGERTLRIYCAQILRLSPFNYQRLRRMNLVRTALRHADPANITVADVARRHGFSELGRFAVAYRILFGETPSATLRGRSTIGSFTYEAELT